MATLSHIAGSVSIDGVPAQRDIIIIKIDPSGREVIAEGASESDGTFDISYLGWSGPVIALSIDKYGDQFEVAVPLNVGDVVHPAVANGYVYYVTLAGTTGDEEPVWLIDSAVVSGSVTFSPQPFYRPIASGPLMGAVIDENFPVDDYWVNVSLLMHCEAVSGSQSFIDSGLSNLTITAIGSDYPNADAATKKFGTSSICFDGSTSKRLSIVNDGGFDFDPSSDFTVEAWVKTNSSVGYGMIIGVWEAGTSKQWFFGEASSKLVFAWFMPGFVFAELQSPTITLHDDFHHVAVCRAGTVLRLFLDGMQVATGTIGDLNNPAGSPNALMGSDGDNSNSFDGWIDEVRVTKGVARYTGSFTVPDAPFPEIGP